MKRKKKDTITHPGGFSHNALGKRSCPECKKEDINQIAHRCPLYAAAPELVLLLKRGLAYGMWDDTPIYKKDVLAAIAKAEGRKGGA